MSSSAHLITDRNRQKWSSLKCYQWCATCYPHSLPKVYPFFGCFDPLGQLVIGFVIFYYLIENHCWLEWHMISQKYTNINHNRCNDFFRKKNNRQMWKDHFSPQSQLGLMHHASEEVPSLLSCSSCRQCAEVWNHSVNEKEHIVVDTLYAQTGKSGYRSHTKHSSVITELLPDLFSFH